MSNAGLFAGEVTEIAPEADSATEKTLGYVWMEYGEPPPPSTAFEFEITINDEVFTMPTPEFLWDDVTAAVYNYTVDWGDGSQPEVITGWSTTHDYTGFDGVALISITGTMQCWRWGNFTPSANALLVTNFVSWGNVGLLEFMSMFRYLNNMDYSATDAPVFGLAVTDYSHSVEWMFDETGKAVFTPPSGNVLSWDVSPITDFSRMFADCNFDFAMHTWDVSNGTTFFSMFLESGFNPDLSAWTPTKSTSFNSMLFVTEISVANYDLLLNAWSLLTYDNTGMTLTCDQNYTIATSQAARDILTDPPNSWTINDDGGV